MAITNMGEMQYLVIGEKKYSIPTVDVSGKLDVSSSTTISSTTVNASTNYGNIDSLGNNDYGLIIRTLDGTYSSSVKVGSQTIQMDTSYDDGLDSWSVSIYTGLASAGMMVGSNYIQVDTTGIYLYGNSVQVPTPTNLSDAATKQYVDDSNKCWYGTSSTTASTATKVVTCSGFKLSKGAIIGIFFSTANTAATPTLNVNSTGAKSVYVGQDTPNATTNVLKWSANTIVYFMYDGSYYRYITSTAAGSVVQPRGANTWYGTSSTLAATSSKTSTIDNYVLTKGSLVTIAFSTANTYVSGALTLEVNSTGAKYIYYNNAQTSSSNTLTWEANSVLTFMFDGTYYHYIGSSKDATKKYVDDTVGNIETLLAAI